MAHLIVNEEVLSEYTEVLGRPRFDLEAQRVQTILETIRLKGIHAPALATSRCP